MISVTIVRLSMVLLVVTSGQDALRLYGWRTSTLSLRLWVQLLIGLIVATSIRSQNLPAVTARGVTTQPRVGSNRDGLLSRIPASNNRIALIGISLSRVRVTCETATGYDATPAVSQPTRPNRVSRRRYSRPRSGLQQPTAAAGTRRCTSRRHRAGCRPTTSVSS